MTSFIIPAIIVSVFYILVLNETYAGNLCSGGVNPRPQDFLNNNQLESIRRTTGTGSSSSHRHQDDEIQDDDDNMTDMTSIPNFENLNLNEEGTSRNIRRRNRHRIGDDDIQDTSDNFDDDIQDTSDNFDDDIQDTSDNFEQTHESKLQRAQECVRDMIVSCRGFYQDDFGNIRAKVPETFQCIENAIKFWVDTIRFPTYIIRYYTQFINYIETVYIKTRKRYCRDRFKGHDVELRRPCINALMDFGDTVEDTLNYAFFKTRLIDYCPLTTIRKLNKEHLNYFKPLSQRFDYEREIVGPVRDFEEEVETRYSLLPSGFYSLEVRGANVSGANNESELDDSSHQIPYEYLIELISQIKGLTSSGIANDPVSYCVKSFFGENDNEFHNPNSIVTADVINEVFN